MTPRHPDARRFAILLRRLCCAAACWMAAGAGVGDGSWVRADESTAPAADASSQQIARWAAELDDDRYVVREAAQQFLQEAGAAALGPVAQAAERGSLESSTRALNILLEWSEAAEPQLALPALDCLSKLPNRPLEAAYAAERLARMREQAAMAELEKLGARISLDQQVAGLNRIAQIDLDDPPLQVIVGPEWKGGVEGLRWVADMPHVTTVSLHSAPLGDEVAPQLEKLPHIRRLEVYGTPLSDEAIAQLQASLVGIEIDVRHGGARLGIRGMPVQEVVANSAAAKAGIERGDSITQLGDVAINDFEHLTAEIAKFRPGDEVQVTLLRQGNVLTRTVRFDRWGQDEVPLAPTPALPAKLRAPGEAPINPPVLNPLVPNPR